MPQTSVRGCWFYPGSAIFSFFIHIQCKILIYMLFGKRMTPNDTRLWTVALWVNEGDCGHTVDAPIKVVHPGRPGDYHYLSPVRIQSHSPKIQWLADCSVSTFRTNSIQGLAIQGSRFMSRFRFSTTATRSVKWRLHHSNQSGTSV